MRDERLPVADVSDRMGIRPATWRAYVSRGRAPSPDGHFDDRTPYWLESTIEAYKRTRKGTAGRPRAS